MKKTTKRAWSFMLTMAMLLFGTCFAFAAGPAVNQEMTTNWNSGVTNPVFSVVVPTAVPFALDAYEIGEEGQISMVDASILNKSNVPVQVQVAFKATPKTGVEIVTDSALISTDSSVTAKKIFMQVKTPKAVETVDPKGTKVTSVTYAGVSTTAGVKAMGPDTATSGGAAFCIMLDKAKTDEKGKVLTTDMVTTSGATTFRFDGKLNPGAPWAASDVTVSMVYSFRGLTADEKSVRTTDGFTANTHRLISIAKWWKDATQN